MIRCPKDRKYRQMPRTGMLLEDLMIPFLFVGLAYAKYIQAATLHPWDTACRAERTL